MAAKIVWSENALEDLENLKLYLERNWPEQVLNLVMKKLVNKLAVLEIYPNIGRASIKYPNRRRTLLTKHNLIIYSVKSNEILIEAIFDTRQDPDKLAF
jgi:plasmid stabilization system protein ParE